MEQAAPQDLDVAIVGLGIAGLYAALRLSEDANSPPERLGLFESAGRVGGRLRTFSFEECPALRIDLGAALLWPDSHKRLAALALRLGVATQPLTTTAPENPIELRGRRRLFGAIRTTTFRPPFPFRVGRKRQARRPMRLLRDAFRAFLPNGILPPASEVDRLYRDARFQGRPLRHWSSYAALQEALDPEALAYLEARVGFSLFTRAPSLAHAIETIADMAEWRGARHSVVGGFEGLATAAAARLAKGGLEPHLGMTLVSLRRRTDRKDGFELLFRKGNGGVAALTARSVILAMPRGAVEAIPELAGDRNLAALLESVEPWPFGRAVLLYRQAWWRRAGLRHGFALSDRPIRQVWYLGSEADGDGAEGEGFGALAAHFDGDDFFHWQRLAAGGEGLGQGLSRFDASHPLSLALHAEVVRLHAGMPVGAIPLPLATAFEDWTVPPFGGAMHVWSRGADACTASAAMLRPLQDANLFVCGEAWSRRQGWVEGALATTDAVLERYFAVPAAGWEPTARDAS